MTTFLRNSSEKAHHVDEGIILFSSSTRMSVKLIMLINVKIPTIVDILTSISMVNTILDALR